MNLVSKLRAEALAARALPVLSSGLVSGLYMVIYVFSAGGIIFSGALAPFFSQGTGTILFGTFVVCLVITLTSGYRGAISALPSPAIVVLVAIGSTIALQGDMLFMTMVATMMVGALAGGTCFLTIGRFRLANLVRFIPFSVAGGFLAGTGGALCLAALPLMGVTPEWPMSPSFLEPSALWSWVPGVAYGLGLFIATKRWSSSVLLPVSFVSIAALYHLGLAFLDISGNDARAMGLLFARISQGGLWPAFAPGDLAQVDWAAVAIQIPNMLALILVVLLSLVMYLSGIELAANVELEWNREFKAAGLGSLVAGLGGSPPGCLSTSASIISHKLRAESRLTGVVASLVMGSALIWGDAVLMLVPVPLVAGFLVFIGLVLLDDWLMKSRGALPWTEYAIILLIFVTIVGFGFLEGVGIGMLVTTAFFAVRLSRVEPVEAEFTAREHSSNKIRSIPDRAILREEGTLVRAFRLRGYIFFGSVYPLVERIKQSLRKDPPPACVLLDFSAVAGIDFSAMNALCMFVKAAHADGARVVLSAASEQFRDRLSQDLPPSVYDTLLLEPDADRALERCEDIIIAARRPDPGNESGLRNVLLDHVAGDMERHLDRQILFEELVHDLRDWLEPHEYDTGETLVAIGEPLQGLQLLTTGRASVYDSTGARLFQCGPGDAVEPRGAFGAHAATATAVADEPCRAMMLTPAARQWLEEREAQLLLTLYGYLLTNEERAAPPAAAP
ncbi:MAG: SulP family inorganic anion transporter [Chromatiales bacterium]|nr:SulP family inorganic anion transporter [Chromatiales bacterium]